MGLHYVAILRLVLDSQTAFIRKHREETKHGNGAGDAKNVHGCNHIQDTETGTLCFLMMIIINSSKRLYEAETELQLNCERFCVS